MTFEEALNSKLPSKQAASEGFAAFLESEDSGLGDIDENKLDKELDTADESGEAEECGDCEPKTKVEGEDAEECGDDVPKTKVAAEDGEDPEDLVGGAVEDLQDDAAGPDPEDDEELEREITDAEIEAIAGVDELDEEELSPEEEMEADKMMQLAATTMLINNELSEDERADFLESPVETQIAINEGFLFDSDVALMKEEADIFTEAKIYTKTRVQFNKTARLAQLHAIAINVCARAKHDPDWIKLTKLNRTRKIFRARLRKKYGSRAKKLMRVYFQRLKNSKSSALQNIAKKNEQAVKESAEYNFFDQTPPPQK